MAKKEPKVPLYKRRTVDHGIYEDEEYSNAPDFEGEPAGYYPPLIGDSPLSTLLVLAANEAKAELDDPANERSRNEAFNVQTRLDAVQKALDRGDIDRAAQKAFYLGEALERLRVMRLEPYALRGKKHKHEYPSKGGKARRILNDEQEQLAIECYGKWRAQGTKHTPACATVAKWKQERFEKNISAKQIARIVEPTRAKWVTA